MEAKDRVLVALDGMTPTQELILTEAIGPNIGGYKRGLEQIMRTLHDDAFLVRHAFGLMAFLERMASNQAANVASLVQLHLRESGDAPSEFKQMLTRAHRLQTEAPTAFLDPKLHDIPETVAKATRYISAMPNLRMFNVHCSGGPTMMRKAVEMRNEIARQHGREGTPKVLGVTLLTSLSAEDLIDVGFLSGVHRPEGEDPELKRAGMKFIVGRMARLAKECGLDGVVCSAQEIEVVREACGPEFLIVVPGIRFADGASKDDQKRVGTPADAIRAGATHLVVGRPITQAEVPADAAKRMVDEVASVL